MARRVVVGPLPGGGHGIRVSRPGADVMDANLAPKQVAFDSRWPAALNVHKVGSGVGSGAIYFDKVFAVPPMVIVCYTDAQGRYRVMRAYGDYGGPPGSTGEIPAKTYTDRFQSGVGAGVAFSYYVLER